GEAVGGEPGDLQLGLAEAGRRRAGGGAPKLFIGPRGPRLGAEAVEERRRLLERGACLAFLFRAAEHLAVGEQCPRTLEGDRAALVLVERPLERLRRGLERPFRCEQQPSAPGAHREAPRDSGALGLLLEALDQHGGPLLVADAERSFDGVALDPPDRRLAPT